jgi:hypothetical protein
VVHHIWGNSIVNPGSNLLSGLVDERLEARVELGFGDAGDTLGDVAQKDILVEVVGGVLGAYAEPTLARCLVEPEQIIRTFEKLGIVIVYTDAAFGGSPRGRRWRGLAVAYRPTSPLASDCTRLPRLPAPGLQGKSSVLPKLGGANTNAGAHAGSPLSTTRPSGIEAASGLVVVSRRQGIDGRDETCSSGMRFTPLRIPLRRYPYFNRHRFVPVWLAIASHGAGGSPP